MSVAIRPLFSSDWEAVRTIYIEGLETRQATFETEAPHWERIARLDGIWRDTVILERRSGRVDLP